MKKLISSILCAVMILTLCVTAAAETSHYNAGPDIMAASRAKHTVLYAADGRTITVSNNAVEAYMKYDWFDAPVVTLYNENGETTVVYKSDAHLHIAAGWLTSPPAPPAEPEKEPENEKEDTTNKKKAVALTFDDGPSKHTKRILDCLEANNAKATFFVVGTNVLKFGDTLRRAHSLGMEIGNHTVNHPDLKKLPEAEVKSEIKLNADYVEAAIGVRPKLVRPPYGNQTSAIIALINQPFILWSIDTLDWKTRNAQKTIDSVLSSVKDGDIVLMHDLYEPTAEAAEKIIPELIKRGYDLVTVSELAKRKGVTLEAKTYSSIR